MLVYPLTTPGIDPKVAGTKGATLALLHKAGLPIPFSLLISGEAFSRYFIYTELIDRVREIFPPKLPNDLIELARLSKETQMLFEDTPLPDYLEEELLQDLSSFNSALAMVRSSFINQTNKNLPAGIFDHVARSRGTRSLIRSIRSVWASLYSLPALNAFSEMGVNPLDCAMGVIVQRFVPASIMGSLHSVHPNTGARDVMLFNIHPSNTSPSETAIQTEFTIDRKTSSQFARPEIFSPSEPLRHNEIESIHQYVKEVESIFHLPARVDFAISKRVIGKASNGNGKVYILQAEPMQDVPEAPITWTAPVRDTIYRRNGLSAAAHYPATPLFSSLGLRVLNTNGSSENKDPSPFELTVINGWVYSASPFSAQKSFTLFKAWFRMLKGTLDQPIDRSAQAVMKLRELIDQEANLDLLQLSGSELFEVCRRLLFYTAEMLHVFSRSSFLSAGVSQIVFNTIYQLMTNEEDPHYSDLLYIADSLPHKVETSAHLVADSVTNSELRRLIAKTSNDDLMTAIISGDTPIPTLQLEWENFCKTFHRELNANGSLAFDLDFCQPTLKDSPWIFAALVQAVIDEKVLHPSDKARKSAQVENMMFANFEKGWTRNFIPFAKKAHEWALNSAKQKEESLGAISASYPVLQTALLLIGEMFVKASLLDRADSIFWLYENEIEDILADQNRWEQRLSFEEIVEIRKQEWRDHLALNPPSLIPTDHWLNQTVYRSFHQAELLRGTAFAPGVATGPVRIVRRMEDLRDIQTGDIVVTATLDAGWNMIFHKASGLVCESGGMFNFSSTHARQSGLPLVISVKNAVTLLKNGQIITVDGNQGVVRLANSDSD